MKLCKVVARATLLYGSEMWVTTKRDMTRLEAAEMRFLRSVKGYTRLDKIRSEVIRRELEIPGIQDVRSKYSKTCLKRNAIVPVFFSRFHRFPFYKGLCFKKPKYKKYDRLGLQRRNNLK